MPLQRLPEGKRNYGNQRTLSLVSAPCFLIAPPSHPTANAHWKCLMKGPIRTLLFFSTTPPSLLVTLWRRDFVVVSYRWLVYRSSRLTQESGHITTACRTDVSVARVVFLVGLYKEQGNQVLYRASSGALFSQQALCTPHYSSVYVSYALQEEVEAASPCWQGSVETGKSLKGGNANVGD